MAITPKRLAKVIEEYTRQYKQERTKVEYGDMVDDREFSEGLEKHLRDNFLILSKELGGKR